MLNNHISNIIRLLRDDKRVANVEALELPVEVRSDKKFSSESGVSKTSDKSQSTGAFIIQIVMNAKDAE